LKEKLTIYLGDLVHNYLGGGSYMFPLNIGFVASYAKKVFGNRVDIELFKYPDALVRRLKEKQPDVLGLSAYSWNANLNYEVSRLASTLSPETLIVRGGPNINQTDAGYGDFFRKNPQVDFYVLNEGEIGFASLLERYVSSDYSIDKAKMEPVNGCVCFREGKPVVGKRLERIEELDMIPSPYLTGVLDQFFDNDLIPIAETNRGCPFACTYCAQGLVSQHRVKVFDIERVLEELTYIATKVNKTNLLCFADANFGIFPRDTRIAEHIRKLQTEKNYPRRCVINWIKTNKSIELAKIIGEATYLVSSLQSLDPVALKHIKRHNIDDAHFKEIIDHVNEAGGVSGTEIILALPGETKESHLKSLGKLFEWDVSYIICYNCLLINGSELTLPEAREQFKIKTKFRFIDSAFGKYDDIISIECEEGIRSTSTMTEDEILFFRPVHWLIQFMWNYRCYYDLLKFVHSHGISPLDFILKIIDDASNAPESVKGVFDDFSTEAVQEWYDSSDTFREHYNKPENFAILESGEIGKMNGKYTWRIILECKNAFDMHVQNVAGAMLPDHTAEIAEVVRFCSESLIDFAGDFNPDVIKQVFFEHNVLKWKQGRYEAPLDKMKVKYTFSFPEEKRKALNVLMNQYKHDNMNVTMRKMSEHMRITDLYYDVECDA
jgi:radical SAM superfamily enzyme YgiQ (UPF0313 family)